MLCIPRKHDALVPHKLRAPVPRLETEHPIPPVTRISTMVRSLQGMRAAPALGGFNRDGVKAYGSPLFSRTRACGVRSVNDADTAGDDRIRRLISEEPADRAGTDAFSWLRRMCRVVTQVMPATGAGVSLMTSDGAPGLAAASDPTSEVIEELQLVLGEGPCLEAYASRRPVLAEDLGALAAGRWSAYAPAAREQGVEAVFAFPMQIGRSCLGVLDIYRDRPGLLPQAAVDEASRFARLALVTLLDEHESLSSSLLGDVAADQYNPFSYRLEVHQAAGMVMSQLGVGTDEAMLRLRAYSFADNRRISQVAGDIISRKLVLERDDS